MSDWVVITEYLARTADGRIVAETDPEARFLAYVPGQRIPLEEAKRLGLLKQVEPPEDKQAEPEEDKGMRKAKRVTSAKRRR